MPKSSREQIDKDEKKILAELRNNAKGSIDEIAKKCGFSRQKVWRIIKHLEKNKTIWGYNTIIDPEKVNLKEYFLLIKRTNKPIEKEKLEMILNRKISKDIKKLGMNLEYSCFIHGSYDWFICLTAEDIIHVKKFTHVFSTLFKDYVSNLQVFEVIFPIEKYGIVNPKKDEFFDFFIN